MATQKCDSEGYGRNEEKRTREREKERKKERKRRGYGDGSEPKIMREGLRSRDGVNGV